MATASTSSLVGVAVAISGNICISLALNVQKLAHQRLQKEAENARSSKPSSRSTAHHSATSLQPLTQPLSERTPLIVPHSPSRYHSAPTLAKPALVVDLNHNAQHPVLQRPTRPRTNTANSKGSIVTRRAVRKESGRDDSQGMNYIQSKLWWLGIALMTLGELGNFISYGFAPASIVAPLGTFALVANCALAPLLLGEKFRKSDLLGVFLAVIGAVAVVISGNSDDEVLNPRQLQEAIAQPAFIVWVCVSVAFMLALGTLSKTKFADRFVYIDVGMCAFLGSFTVLSTKAFSSLLNLLFLDSFRYWITWPVVAVLVITALTQVAYLNKALQKFDARVVVPVQFTLFTVLVVVSSAILYGDFRSTDPHRTINFLFGCFSIFGGVYILNSSDNDESNEQDDPVTPHDEHPTPSRPDDRPRSQSLSSLLPASAPGPRPSPALVPALLHRRSNPSMPFTSPGYFLIASPHSLIRRRTGERSEGDEHDANGVIEEAEEDMDEDGNGNGVALADSPIRIDNPAGSFVGSPGNDRNV